eukprot:50845-Eustigmatos_ZCMA.PRE.1
MHFTHTHGCVVWTYATVRLGAQSRRPAQAGMGHGRARDVREGLLRGASRRHGAHGTRRRDLAQRKPDIRQRVGGAQ